MKAVEAQGHEDCHDLPGGSNETGCWQFLDSTYVQYAKEIYGYVPPRTYINERHLVVMKVQKWLKAGYTAEEIGRIWNGGDTTIKRGINSHGVAYDTGLHGEKVVRALAYIQRTYEETKKKD